MSQQICVECHQQFVLSADEKARFESLMSTAKDFQMPKRCGACRKARRNANPRPQQTAPAAPIATYAPHQQVAPSQNVLVEKKEVVRLVIATADFEALVAGKEVTWRGVSLKLADLGFDQLRQIIERVERDIYESKFNR